MIYFQINNIVIRSIVKDDIIKLPKQFEEQNWHKPLDLFEKYYQMEINNERKIIIAEVNGEIAGYVTLKPFATEGPFKNQRIPEIEDFIVFIKFQRRGIGNKILDVAEEIASQFSNKVCLSVGVHSGYGTAQRMYIKRGYIPDGSGVWYQNKQLDQYAQCFNDDDLTLHLSKDLIKEAK